MVFFIVAELDSTSLYVMRRHGAGALGHIYGIAPDVVAKAGEYFRQQLRHVEVALADGRSYLMGDRFTCADILLTTCLDWAIDYRLAFARMPTLIWSGSSSVRRINTGRQRMSRTQPSLLYARDRRAACGAKRPFICKQRLVTDKER